MDDGTYAVTSIDKTGVRIVRIYVAQDRGGGRFTIRVKSD